MMRTTTSQNIYITTAIFLFGLFSSNPSHAQFPKFPNPGTFHSKNGMYEYRNGYKINAFNHKTQKGESLFYSQKAYLEDTGRKMPSTKLLSLIRTQDKKTAFFTKFENDNGVVLPKLYKASLIGGKWTNIVKLPFNENGYSILHPCLSADEKYLYFSSDMPGSLGGFDLFKVRVKNKLPYGKPVNLGKKINTTGMEITPFISSFNKLYFASDGHPGYGGLDLFLYGKGEVKNLGRPINSPSNDFSIHINESHRTGILSSERNICQHGEHRFSIHRKNSKQAFKIKDMGPKTKTKVPCLHIQKKSDPEKERHLLKI